MGMISNFIYLFLSRLQNLLSSAFGLVAALAWNGAIKDRMKMKSPTGIVSPGQQWKYAVQVTLVAVTATMLGEALLQNFTPEDEDDKK